MDKRLSQLSDWLTQHLSLTIKSIEPASNDASFRRYFRVNIEKSSSLKLPETFIVMDSPPQHEDNAQFIHCTKVLARCGLNVPNIYAQNLKQGFLVISDLGTAVYQQALNIKSADALYGDAMHALIKMQAHTKPKDAPLYTAELLNNEMQLFDDWYIQHYHESNLTSEEQTILHDAQQLLVQSALEQPQVLVHRDYHCRNLLVCNENNPAIIDYQDMVIGPITYDLVSLFKDCYIQWPIENIERWIEFFRHQSKELGIHSISDSSLWRRWFDWMGVQRHLKVLGIFSRLYYRDAKDQYLQDIPLTYEYTLGTCERYAELHELGKLLKRFPSKHF